jgi:hypothetical protein
MKLEFRKNQFIIFCMLILIVKTAIIRFENKTILLLASLLIDTFKGIIFDFCLYFLTEIYFKYLTILKRLNQ